MTGRFFRFGTVLSCLTLLAFLSGCSQNGNLPADAPTALIYGMAGGPVYEALRAHVDMTVSDGSQQATDFDLLILDGDAHTAESLRDDPLVHEAIRAGTWVLGLDLEEDQKKFGLGYLIEASSGGPSPAYLTRKTWDAADHPTSHMIEFQHEGPDAATSRAERIVHYLKNPDLAAQQSIAVPDDLLHATFTFIEDVQVDMPGINTTTDPPGQSQTASWTIQHAVKIFLENSNTPQGDFQWVLLETSGTGNPNALAVNKTDEIGYYQTQFNHNMTFVDTSGNKLPNFTLIKSQPVNTNNVETVTTNVGFSVGFNQAQGGLGSFSYSNATTKTITAWKLVNRSDDTNAFFQIASSNPVDGLNTTDSSNGESGVEIDPSAFSSFYDGNLPVQPNTLSIDTMEYFTQALWQSGNVIDDTVNLSVFQLAYYTDAWCYNYTNYANGGCGDREGDDNTRLSRHLYFSSDGPSRGVNVFAVNLGAVVPIPIKSLTFSPNPVVAGQTTTGTLTLDKAAETDIILDISSESQFATPTQNKYTIPKGSDHIDFPVETGQDGTGQDFSAKITAFYAEGQDAILNISQPTSGD